MIVTLLRLTIACDEPFAIAAPETAVAIDRPVARDPRTGAPHVPATSLAGSLRSHLIELGLDEQLLGNRRPAAEGPGSTSPARSATGDALEPSALRLLGTRVDLHDQSTAVRRQTAVDRTSGSAAVNTLREGEVVPAGTEITLYASADRALDQVELDALAAWVPFVGGDRSLGLGAARLVSLRWGTLDLDRLEDLERYLLLGGPELVDAVVAHEATIPDPVDTAVLDIEFEVVDGLLASGAADGARLTAHRRSLDGPPVLEGSQLKGVFRSRLEFILSSVGVDVCDSSKATCGRCTVCHSFGSTEQRGLLVFHAAEVQQSTEAWRDHVGIDRVSGGARNHLLFSEEVAASGTIRLRVTIQAGAECPERLEDLLLWVVRDLDDGLVGLGGRTSRGLGTVRLLDDAQRVRLAALPPVLSLVGDGSAPDSGVRA